jgi:hypothetical protein
VAKQNPGLFGLSSKNFHSFVFDICFKIHVSSCKLKLSKTKCICVSNSGNNCGPREKSQRRIFIFLPPLDKNIHVDILKLNILLYE